MNEESTRLLFLLNAAPLAEKQQSTHMKNGIIPHIYHMYQIHG